MQIRKGLQNLWWCWCCSKCGQGEGLYDGSKIQSCFKNLSSFIALDEVPLDAFN